MELYSTIYKDIENLIRIINVRFKIREYGIPETADGYFMVPNIEAGFEEYAKIYFYVDNELVFQTEGDPDICGFVKISISKAQLSEYIQLGYNYCRSQMLYYKDESLEDLYKKAVRDSYEMDRFKLQQFIYQHISDKKTDDGTDLELEDIDADSLDSLAVDEVKLFSGAIIDSYVPFFE